MWHVLSKNSSAALLLSLLVFSNNALCSNSEKPLWEVGAGLFAFTAPHYLGSDQRYQLVLPAPALIYRGRLFKSDKRGLRSVLLASDHWKLSLSFSGALPVNSEDNKAREGMDDLDTLIEFGPRVQYYLSQPNDDWQFYFDLPLRIALSFNGFNSTHRGFSTNPSFVTEFSQTLSHGDLSWGLAFGPQYASNQYHRYFYDVNANEATADREQYKAQSGYLGTRLSSRVSYRINNWRSSLFLRHYNLQNAANERSPLLIDTQYWLVGFNIAYFFAQSSRTAN